MPKINIIERDLTSPGSLNLSANVVYVPGAAKDFIPVKYKKGVPILYETISAFTEDWGNYPATLGVSQEGDQYYDTGYIYAAELLRLGTPVLFDCCIDVDTSARYDLDSSNKPSISNNDGKYYKPGSAYTYMYLDVCNNVKEHLNTFATTYEDKGLFDIKFVSNGGYTSANDSIYLIASNRQDCVALLDPWEHVSINTLADAIPDNTLVNGAYGIPNISSAGQYASIFAPCGIFAPPCISAYKKSKDSAQVREEFYPSFIRLPGSFAYLMALANATNQGSQNWLAMAGASRGAVPYLESLVEEVTEAQIDKLQKRDALSINPIATIRPFGMVVWGNRTAYNNAVKGNLVASSFLNIRNLVSEIKKTVWVASRQLTFEQNSDILWVNFRSLITPTLDQMVTGGGLSGFELIRKTAKEKATLKAIIRLYAIEAVEDFDITIELADDTTAVIE